MTRPSKVEPSLWCRTHDPFHFVIVGYQPPSRLLRFKIYENADDTVERLARESGFESMDDVLYPETRYPRQRDVDCFHLISNGVRCQLEGVRQRIQSGWAPENVTLRPPLQNTPPAAETQGVTPPQPWTYGSAQP
jgi:hypothetical protein